MYMSSHMCTWWRHQMETFSALLALCAGNSPVTGEFPAQSQWRWALMFSLNCAWTDGWVSNRHAGDLRHHRAHYDVTVMRKNDDQKPHTSWAILDWQQTHLSTHYPVYWLLIKGCSKGRANSRFAPSQWETALLCNDVSHWLGANLASARERCWWRHYFVESACAI